MNQITIKNDTLELTVLDYGAIIQKLMVNDKYGNLVNTVVGHESPEDYLNDEMFLGACIGSYAGRIAHGSFSLHGEKYNLYKKDEIHLHGGQSGFNQKYFTIEKVSHGKEPFIKLSYLSPNLEEGYPGNLTSTVTYELIGNSLKITHEATTDKTTVVNLTNHSYFKLDNEPVIDHYLLKLNCNTILETQSNLLPTGKLSSVDNTKYNFQNKKSMGATRLDTPFVIHPSSDFAAELSSEISGIRMTVKTNQPAVVIYTPPTTGSICFETQNFPDAPNHANFPSSILEPNENYINATTFTFNV